MNQFDEAAAVYEDFSHSSFRQELEFPSAMGLLGDVSRLRILDPGRGSGVYNRASAMAGAGTVVGLDESGGMIGYARGRESRVPRGYFADRTR